MEKQDHKRKLSRRSEREMKRISRGEEPIIRAVVIREIVQVDDPPLAIPVADRNVTLTGIAVHPDTYKASSITPPIECQLVPSNPLRAESYLGSKIHQYLAPSIFIF